MSNIILDLDMKITGLIGNSANSIFYNFFSKESLDTFFKVITRFGEGYLGLFIVLICLFLVKVRKKDEYMLLAKGIFFSFISSGIVVSILKRVVGRERPYVSFHPDRFYGLKYLYEHNLLWDSAYHSFPSGHTITIFTTIWYIWLNSKNSAIRIGLLILGCLVGISRVYLSYHWTSDVLFSVFLSYFIARAVDYKLHQKKALKYFKFIFTKW